MGRKDEYGWGSWKSWDEKNLIIKEVEEERNSKRNGIKSSTLHVLLYLSITGKYLFCFFLFFSLSFLLFIFFIYFIKDESTTDILV